MGDFSEMALDMIVQQFECVDDLGKKLAEKLWEVIWNLLRFAEENPDFLRECVEFIIRVDETPTDEDPEYQVIETACTLHEGHNLILFVKIIRTELQRIHCTDKNESPQFESLRSRCLHEIEASIEAKCRINTALLLHDSEDNDEDLGGKSHLVPVEPLLEELSTAKNFVFYLFPPDYRIYDLFESNFLKAMQTQMQLVREKADRMTLKEIFRSVNWLEKSKECAIKLDYTPFLSRSFTDTDALLTEAYMELIKTQVSSGIFTIIPMTC